jgi:hypothetical protein
MTVPKRLKYPLKGTLKHMWRRRELALVLLISTVVLNAAINWGNNAGEDITNSRVNFLSNDRNNFLGAFAGLFYGSIPEILISWWQTLLLFQGLLVVIGLFLFFENEIEYGSKRRFTLICGFAYVVIFLGMAPTRDGAMISFAMFGLGLVQKSKTKTALFAIGILAICTSLTFRPWLSFAFAPIVFQLLAKKIQVNRVILIIICIPVVFLPISFENGVKKVWDFNSAYPEQTVMIHDMTSNYCLSTSQSTRNLAFSQLERLSKNEESLPKVCEFYKPSTWQAVTVPNLTDPRISHLDPPISIIQPENRQEFKKLQINWAKMILDDPGTYIQNHLFFLTQILISGESSKIFFTVRLSEFKLSQKAMDLLWLLISLFQLPVQTLIRLHLLSPLITIAAFTTIHRRYRNSMYLSGLWNYVFTLFGWILVTTVGYVSDNGRYTYLPVILLWAGFLKHSENHETKRG